MEIADLGPFTLDAQWHWYYSQVMPMPVFGGQLCKFVLEGYDDDPTPDDFRRTMLNFLALTPAALQKVAQDVFHYYTDCMEYWDEDYDDPIQIASPADVWSHVSFGSEIFVRRRKQNGRMYASLECNCDWEEEHGLLIVFKEGREVSKIGPYDGHLTHSDAYGDPALEDVVYRSLRS